MKRILFLFSCVLFSFSLLSQAQERPLLPHETMGRGRDTVGLDGRFLSPHDRLRLSEERLMHQKSEMDQPGELSLPEGMRRDPAHGGSPFPPTASPSFPSGLHQSAASTDSVLEAWVALYNGPGNLTDIAYAIALDADGNVYVLKVGVATHGIVLKCLFQNSIHHS